MDLAHRRLVTGALMRHEEPEAVHGDSRDSFRPRTMETESFKQCTLFLVSCSEQSSILLTSFIGIVVFLALVELGSDGIALKSSATVDCMDSDAMG